MDSLGMRVSLRLSFRDRMKARFAATCWELGVWCTIQESPWRAALVRMCASSEY